MRQRIAADAESLKSALAEVLARTHPDNVGAITDDEYRSARRFLAPFKTIYTVNYDLLLYWTLLQVLDPQITNDDGFRTDPDDPDAEWVAWDGYRSSYSQDVYYLHGGLHLFDAGAVLKKLTWVRSGVPLVEQIRLHLDQAEYPLVVTEGSSEEALDKIQHAAYLSRGLRSLASCGGSLFVYGHSLAANDQHVLRRIEDTGQSALREHLR